MNVGYGRERLVKAFEAVNGHFASLFQRLFGGGTAELTLIGSDDPLEAGLEIVARQRATQRKGRADELRAARNVAEAEKFDNLAKINQVRCPIIFLHGTIDSLIPPSHSKALFAHFRGRKELILVEGASHNDLHTFNRYADFMKDVLPVFF